MPDEYSGLDAELLTEPGQVVRESGDRVLLARLVALAVSAQIDVDDTMIRRQVTELRCQERMIAGPAVDQHDRGVALSTLLVRQRHAIARQFLHSALLRDPSGAIGDPTAFCRHRTSRPSRLHRCYYLSLVDNSGAGIGIDLVGKSTYEEWSGASIDLPGDGFAVQAVPGNPDGNLGARGEAEPGQDAGNVGIDGPPVDGQHLGNPPVGESACDEVSDLVLATCEQVAHVYR